MSSPTSDVRSSAGRLFHERGTYDWLMIKTLWIRKSAPSLSTSKVEEIIVIVISSYNNEVSEQFGNYAIVLHIR